jgi:3-deoxy-7-phosphoheptulonate synthase
VHESPEKAFSDGQQTLSYQEAGRLFSRLRQTYQMREHFNNE